MKIEVPTLAELKEKNKKAEIVFWVGCAGSYDERAKKITKAFAKILVDSKISFAVLGSEEICTGDPAKRSGNEFLFQMQAMQNISTLDKYGVKKIVTTCPHCFNTLKNEYPELGGTYEVIHHSQFLDELIKNKKLSLKDGLYEGKRITYHDPCYLGRANQVYESPRSLIRKLKAELVEMKNCKSKGLCCGAGGAQMFKEAEKGDKEINIKRTEQALETNTEIIAAACPFCNTMLSDGIKNKEMENKVVLMDVAELIANAKEL
tara:strand:+ start:904 stop:1689 length:786 start_codon:yes stop_codon:yes gene_type:complete